MTFICISEPSVDLKVHFHFKNFFSLWHVCKMVAYFACIFAGRGHDCCYSKMNLVAKELIYRVSNKLPAPSFGF